MPIPSLPQQLFGTLNEARNGLSFIEISFLTFQAVVQVFIICLSGFWAATSGLLNNDGVKTISRLNVDLFTPALIFSKLASSLSLKKLLEVILIPILYAITTLVSYLASLLVSKWLDLTEPESNFVTAMSVFGNSNSLPVSLTLALAYSLPDLEWDDIQDDTPDKIASRGLIYLLIFQQLGQMLRWSWGYNKLLARQPHHVIFYDTVNNVDIETNEITIEGVIDDNTHDLNTMDSIQNESGVSYGNDSAAILDNGFNDPSITDMKKHIHIHSNGSSSNNLNKMADDHSGTRLLDSSDSVDYHAEDSSSNLGVEEEEEENKPLQRPLYQRVLLRMYGWMNPPLWSMFLAMIVASVPPLKGAFYEDNGFIQHTLSSAIKQLGMVSIPLILVVLGANLAPASDIPPACPHYKRMILGSLLGRMVLPSLVLLPLIVLSVKYINMSIMQDPIFLITSFLLITSPPAIQLSQICQLNELYQKEMAGVLFYGYAILTLPVTIIVVVTCIEAMKWANP